MKTVIVMGLILVTIGIHGATATAMSIDSGENKNVYFDEAGKKLTPLEAYQQAMADKKVLQCSYVEAVGNSKTGKVTLKKVK